MNAVIFCLAIGLFFEARGEPVSGQISVAHVILNRVKDTRYPDNVCDVVYQARKKNGKIVKHKCQFSFYCDGLSDRPSNHDAFRWARHVSMLVLFGLTKDPTDGATHYHTKAVNPDWRINKKHTATIGNHIFYRWLKKPPAF
jgi:spore germination cell wall hydrolase CwlJ-like protein|tara:strand:+ start:4745 stop:5170 length:426 start_codon:yes stop_codon:yes gene_type:complete